MSLPHFVTPFCADSPVTSPVSEPDDYDSVFRQYRYFLYGVVYHSGIPHYYVEEACGDIFVRMMAQDGLAAFDGSVIDCTPRIKAYLASYFSLGARAELSRILTHKRRTVSLDVLPDLDDEDLEPEEPGNPYASDADPVGPGHDLLDELMSRTSGDAQHFIVVASEHLTYTKARAALVASGWDSMRIRRAVTEARLVARSCLAAA